MRIPYKYFRKSDPGAIVQKPGHMIWALGCLCALDWPGISVPQAQLTQLQFKYRKRK